MEKSWNTPVETPRRFRQKVGNSSKIILDSLLQEAITALRAALKDSKTTEFTEVLGRVGKAKEGLKAAISKAQDELMAGVNGRARAVLVEKGVVE